MAEVSSEYWAYNDPRWANDPAYGNPETMKYVGPWEQVLQATGFRGKVYEPMIEMQPDPNGGFVPQEVGQQYTPQAKAAIDSLRAAGYDLRWKHPDKRTFNTYYGLVTPSGEVQDIKIEGSDMGTALKEMIKFAPNFLALYGAGAGLNALLGGAGAAGAGAGASNALAGGIGGLEGAAFADLAAGMLPEFGTIPAYSAGLGGGAGALTALDLANLPSDVLGELAGPEVVKLDAGGGDFLSGMSDVAATEGAGVAGTGILTKGTNIPSAVLGGSSILDKAIDLLKSPAGQAVVGGVGSVVGGITQANAAEAAANQQAEAAQNALQLQREMFEYQKGLLEPYRTAGTAALKRLEGALGLGGPAQPQQMLEMDPGYGFRLGEGMKALERMQAARGNMLSGGALKAGQQYAQNFASNEYDRAFGRLADIAGIGRSTAAQQGTAAQQFGTSAGNVMGQEANALAAGRYGRASAYTGALEGVLGAYENYLNRGQRNQLARDIYGRMLGGGS